ncbi:IclR family transcriptional regulator domain-containing protein [Sinorhizobium terangae]|uniref:IclR family transcriptional regulator domain-containing protein n=1 Tax=Sinorhizobium terangae TaxID=110322 RepID=UPI001F417676|nr:IclR family transcriptional regulator C-terminal domain-containing protein [Sinorhizobium terangae]
MASLEEAEELAQVRRRSYILPRNYARSLVTNEQELSDELKRIREHGFAVSADESVIGIAALAAAIPDREGGVALGCVSVAGPSVRMTSSRWNEIAPDLLAAAKELGEIWPIPRLKDLLRDHLPSFASASYLIVVPGKLSPEARFSDGGCQRRRARSPGGSRAGHCRRATSR